MGAELLIFFFFFFYYVRPVNLVMVFCSNKTRGERPMDSKALKGMQDPKC